MSVAHYRFAPWARRGLVAQIEQPETHAALPSRAKFRVGVTVTNAGDSGVDLSLYGPGDIIGVDSRLIVRTDPRPHCTDVEPNYLPAIEFDPPDFPWMFTPARADGNERLRPWCVLIVVRQDLVQPPKVQPGSPLPVLEFSAAASGSELPDLAESWSWAHTQVATDKESPVPMAQELADKPAQNVSRLLCPRRLEAGKRYLACLVPAFNVGVERGLGGQPAAAAVLGPAWNRANPGPLRLPVYYHWEFATGPEGDFESLARQLKPFRCPETVGFQRMFLGTRDAGLPDLGLAGEAAYTKMDGALRAPKAGSGQLNDIPVALRDALRQVLDAPQKRLEGGPEGSTQALGPPIYGQWHMKQHTVPQQPEWLEEQNLDPRARVAAGLGAEVVRANQDDYMQACWEQVGKVLEANALLNRARLAMEALRRLHERHFRALPPDRLLQLTAPLHSRALQAGGLTIRAGIGRSSLPDASVDAAMRRLTSAQRPLFKIAARRANIALPPSAAVRSTLVQSLAAGRADVDPNRFVPDGLLRVAGLERLTLPAADNARVDLTPIGMPMQLEAGTLRTILGQARQVQTLPAAPAAVRLRADLRTAGLVTDLHLANVNAIAGQLAAEPGAGVTTPGAMRAMIETSRTRPGGAALLMTVDPQRRPIFDALDVDAGGRVLVRTALATPSVPVAVLGPTVSRTSSSLVSRVLVDLPPGALDRRGAIPRVINVDFAGRPTVAAVAAPSAAAPAAAAPLSSNTMPALVRDAVPLGRFENAFRSWAGVAALATAATEPPLVPFAVAPAAVALLNRTDPSVMVPRRISTMVKVGNIALDRLTMPGIKVAPTFDRIMVAPDLPEPAYLRFAVYDRERFLPGVDQIPPNAITLLETNPRFIEAFLVGLNHEMNRELLWRAYPTDQRGTPFRHFWGWLDGKPDIEPIHQWTDGALGTHTRGAGQGGQLVLLVRGQLLRRYPNTVIYAWRAVGGKLKDPPAAADLRPPVFWGQFAPDITFVGLALNDVELNQGDGWFIVLQQQPTEPRFGLDENPPPTPQPITSWTQTSTKAGEFLKVAADLRAGHSAHVATLTLQKPFRVAVHGRFLVTT